MTARLVVAGIGNELRRDDGVGPVVACQVATGIEGSEKRAMAVDLVGPFASPLDLLGCWDRAELAVVIDSVRAGVEPGDVVTVELGTDGDDERVDAVPPASTHGIGLTAVLRIARAVGRAPRRVVLVGVGGEDFGIGPGLSPKARAAVVVARDEVLGIVDRW